MSANKVYDVKLIGIVNYGKIVFLSAKGRGHPYASAKFLYAPKNLILTLVQFMDFQIIWEQGPGAYV